MTLDEVEALQTLMLRHPSNFWNSSAVGWLKIARKTMRFIRSRLKLPVNAKFDEAMQDRTACFLLVYRGIDGWLDGSLTQDALNNALAMEWASFPKTNGKGHYRGQNARISVDQFSQARAAVSWRHLSQADQPSQPIPFRSDRAA